jgi:hypothetical protein
MPDQTKSIYLIIWSWLKNNDLPNWIIFAFTAIVWPLALFYWGKRTVNNIPNLEVSLAKASITINGRGHSAIDINFLNNTGAVVYLTRARIMKCSWAFSVPIDASRDIAENSYELKFMDSNERYIHRQYTLQTDQTVKSCLAVVEPLSDSFYAYRTPWYRRFLRWPKYFTLEYTAMVGDKRYRVSTIY